MASPNYKQVEELLKSKQPFKHNHSMFAIVRGDVYEVYSYSTLIATYHIPSGLTWVTEQKYSVTTSKQQTLVRRAWGLAVAKKKRYGFSD